MNMKKESLWRNKKYLKWVSEQPSIISGTYGCDAHHVKGHGFGGMGIKPPDWAVIPLTRAEHTELHHIGFRAWEEHNGSQLFLLMNFWRQNFDTIKEFFK